MNCKIVATQDFSRDAKRLSKKYISLKNELKELQEQLLQNPQMGILIHENTYKIRLSVKSKNKGKSGGLRVITYIVKTEEENQSIIIILVAIYDKSEAESMPKKQLLSLIDEIEKELDKEDKE